MINLWKIFVLFIFTILFLGCATEQTYPPLMEYQKRLRCSNISIGMSEEEVLRVLGVPNRKS